MRGIGKHEPPPETQGAPEDNTSDHVTAQVRVWADGGPLIHAESAREIASWWHSPSARDEGFTAFASTGTILCSLVHEIDRERRKQAGTPGSEAAANIADFNALEAYVIHAGWECPGVTDSSACDYVWSADSGCAPHWNFADESGNTINGSPYAEEDAHEKSLWIGPDGPEETFVRNAEGQWERDS